MTEEQAPDDAVDLGELDETSRVLEAAELARKAEGLFASGDLGGALACITEAKRLDAGSAEHLALHGYLLGIGGAGAGALREGLSELDAALARDGDHVRTLYYRGVLRRRLGNEAEALADFTRAAQLDPGDIDVQRELRAGPPSRGKAVEARGKALEKTATKAPVTRPVVSSAPWFALSKPVLALLAAASLVGLGVGGRYALQLMKRPPAAERSVRLHLVRNAADHALGPAHQGAYEHQDALDAMGAAGAKVVTSLLRDGDRAADDEVRTSWTYQQLANEYLVHYAGVLAKKPPPESEGQDWVAMQAAWSAWLAQP